MVKMLVRFIFKKDTTQFVLNTTKKREVKDFVFIPKKMKMPVGILWSLMDFITSKIRKILLAVI